MEPSKTTEVGPPGPELGHHGITVRDLDAAARFFTGVFALVPGPRIELDEAFSAGVTGVPGARISVVLLQGRGFTLELLEYHGPNDRAKASQVRPCDAGAAHLALYVADLEDVVARAEPYGWRPAGTVQPITVGPRRGGLAVYLRDPGGAILELVQRPGPPA